MALTAEVLGTLAFTVIAFYGVAGWALVRTLRQEGEKVDLLESEGRIDTHSPRALADLGEWIRANPDDEDVERARRQYDDCVDALRASDRHYYAWTDAEIDSLERP